MAQFFVLLLIFFVAVPGFANPCLNRGSCFKFDNQHNHPVKIICHDNTSGTMQVIAAEHSQGLTQFDISLNDGLGYPGQDKLDCVISFANSERDYYFSFYNPFWGPIVSFYLRPGYQLNVQAFDKWGSQQINYDFNWE